MLFFVLLFVLDGEHEKEEASGNISEYEKRQRGISYLKWLSSVHTRIVTITKKAQQIIESEENQPGVIMQALQEIHEISNEEFQTLHVTALEASDHLAKELMRLFDSKDSM